MEQNSKLWTSDALCHEMCMVNKECNRHLYFPGQHYSVQGFFPDFSITYAHFRCFSTPRKFLH